MLLSRYVLTYRDVRRGEHVLYDVVGDRYVGVDDAGLESIQGWRARAPTAEEAEAARSLAEMGFVVPDAAADDARLAVHERSVAEGIPGTAYVTLMPTLACDLACDYCIQKDHPQVGHMKPDVEAAALAWIAGRVVATRARRLVVHYLGGEPLVRRDFVLRTATWLAQDSRGRGVAFEWEITSNGVQLDVAFARAMAALGPGSIKVTLDGDRETHDAARTFRGGRGSFDRVFAAMAAVARQVPGVRVRIGGNFRPGQEASYERLLDRIRGAGLAGKIDSFRVKPVIEAGGCASACGSGGADSLVRIGASARAKGVARQASGGIDEVSPCELHWDRAWTIDPAGRVYKCVAVAGRPEMALGDVVAGAGRPDPLTAGKPWSSCGDCAFVPVCRGGCLGGKYAAGGRLGEVACDREGLDIRFREEIVRRYLEEFPPAAVQPAA
ncbi:MAG TPA: radical SAM protein [Anaeromyxobacteraceae bacterium]